MFRNFRRYEIHFLEIGTDGDHVHFLVQSVPTYSPTKIVRTIKSITAREIFRRIPSVKKDLWGGEFWTDGYYISSVGKKGNETVIKTYIQEQGKEDEYKQLHQEQLKLFQSSWYSAACRGAVHWVCLFCNFVRNKIYVLEVEMLEPLFMASKHKFRQAWNSWGNLNISKVWRLKSRTQNMVSVLFFPNEEYWLNPALFFDLSHWILSRNVPLLHHSRLIKNNPHFSDHFL